MQRTCCAGWGCSAVASCFGPPLCYWETRSASKATCLGAFFALRVSGAPTARSSSTTGTLLASAVRFLRAALPIASRFESDRMTRIDKLLFPPLATREALANALCHRDYAMGGGSIGLAVYNDCLEVTSTGLLHFGLTPDDLFEPHQSRPWNPLIARTFYRRGIIEEWGRVRSKWWTWRPQPGYHVPRLKSAATV